MAFAPSVPTEDSPSEAFLSNNNEEDSDFSALDSMTPHSYNAGHHYSQQQQQPSQHFGAVVPHSLYNNQGASANYRNSGASVDGSMNSGSTGDNNIGRVGDGVNGGFAGVSESLFDRIRARAEQQQKPQQSSYSSSASQSPHQQHQPQTQQQVKSAFVSQQQQQQQQPTLEYEGDSSVGGAFANNHHGNDPNPSTNQATYAFSPPPSELPSQTSQQYSQKQPQQPPRVPTYGPSRNDPHYSSLAHHGHGHGGSTTSLQDKAAMAWENTSSAFKSLWGKASSGAQTIGALAREARAGNGGTGGMRGGEGGYNNNFLLRSEIDDDDDDEMERGVGRGPNASQLHQQQQQIPGAATDTMMTGSNASGVGSGAVGGDQPYSMVTYAKTFCLDVFGFVRDMPLWGKGFFLLLLLWALYAFKG